MLLKPIAATLSLLVLPVAAQTPPPQNVIHLSASASAEVPRDLMSVVFSTSREGPEAAAVQAQLKQALDTALAEARRAARPGELDVRTGQFSLHPRYAPKGGSQGWIGQAELIVEGRDMPAIAQLAGRIQTMTIARVGHSLSREAREKVEGEVSAAAIERFRARAAETARQFGFTGYLLREVHLGGVDAQPPVPLAMARARSASAMGADEALPAEAGKATVLVSVNGSVQLTR